MRKILDYTLLSYLQEMPQWLRDGWQPYGSPFLNTEGTPVQVMVKYEDVEVFTKPQVLDLLKKHFDEQILSIRSVAHRKDPEYVDFTIRFLTDYHLVLSDKVRHAK